MPMMQKEQKKPAVKDDGKEPYFCVRCNYKFRHNPRGVTNLKCPYCGKEDKVVEDVRK